jgi:hypothetical protein
LVFAFLCFGRNDVHLHFVANSGDRKQEGAVFEQGHQFNEHVLLLSLLTAASNRELLKPRKRRDGRPTAWEWGE